MSQTMRKYLHQWTRPAADHGFEGERRLQDEFDTTAIKIRYDIRKRLCQVWFIDNKDCYIICVIPTPYHSSYAVYELKRREQKRSQLRQEYLDQQEQEERDKRRYIRSIAEEVGGAYRNVALNKVSLGYRK